MSYEISDLARKYAPWSVSKVELASTCPKQFAFRHIEKREKGLPSEGGSAVGTAAHSVLEHRLEGKSAKEARELALAKTPLTSDERDNLRAVDDAMEAFIVKFDRFCKTYDVVEVLRETKWGMRADGTGCDFFAPDVYFRGVVDLGARHRNGDLTVIDHKSGIARDIFKFPKFKTQIDTYAVLGFANLKGMGGMRGALHFLQGPTDMRLQWFDFTEARKIEKILLPGLFTLINTNAAALVAPFPAKPSLKEWPCGYCAFSAVCSEYQVLIHGA